MPRIRILPESLTNKIAAGEVVERPASVVKELVENALDAGATRIQVDIGKAGRDLISVSDNGCGMERDDALLALERYATSKIATDADLFSIRTLGFRGEALPSIASVSRMTVTTRAQGAETGVKIQLEGGKILDVTETGAAPGTVIAVKNLFFNVPARRKFLKSIATEFGHIADVLTAAALGYPKTGIFLTHDLKAVMTFPAVSDPAHRAAAVLSREAAESLIPLGLEDGHAKVSGWVGPPELFRSTGRSLFLFVNGRIVADRVLTHAVMAGFSGRLQKGRFPLAVVFVAVPENEVDVNVHPAKAQVRFARQAHVHETLTRAVARALASRDHVPWAAPAAAEPMPTPNAKAEAPKAPERLPLTARNAVAEAMASYASHAPRTAPPPPPVNAPAPPASDAEKARAQATPGPAQKAEPAGSSQEPLFTGELSPRKRPPRIIGQLAKSYVLCESEAGLLVVDQHAAHERILFETFRKSFTQGRPEVQSLLIPQTVELSHSEAATLTRLLPLLAQAGLSVSAFSGRTFAVTAVPSHLAQADASVLLRDIAEHALETGRSLDLGQVRDELCAVMACHGSVRARQELSLAEMEELLKSLEACESPSQCPHGRPVFLRFTREDLEKGFKRR
ncbi:MAG: DNA mismatch repair endonuclease MutL [Thermodesulfobacteriota bacterium]